MFDYTFEKIESPQADEILSRVSEQIEDISFQTPNMIIMSANLPFYPGWRLIEISDSKEAASLKYYVVIRDNDVVALNWTNEPIYTLNKESPISLNEDLVCAYVKFFFAFVRGRHGQFFITESVDEINWKEEPPPAARKAVGKMITPVHVTNTNPDGSYSMMACMMFKDSLFKSAVHVKTDGLVTLSDEELLIEDMPVLDETLGQ